MPNQPKETFTKEELKEFLSDPKRASSDSGSFETHSLRELIELDRYLAERKAGFPKMYKLQPPR